MLIEKIRKIVYVTLLWTLVIAQFTVEGVSVEHPLYQRKFSLAQIKKNNNGKS